MDARSDGERRAMLIVPEQTKWLRSKHEPDQKLGGAGLWHPDRLHAPTAIASAKAARKTIFRQHRRSGLISRRA